MKREILVCERTSNGRPPPTPIGFDVGAGARSQLRALVDLTGDRIHAIAEEFVRHLAADDDVSNSLCAATIDAGRLIGLVQDWIHDILTEPGVANDDVPRLSGTLRSVLLTPSHQRCVARGLAVVRRRLVELCLSLAGEDVPLDPGLPDAVECAVDLEIQAILAVNHHALTARLATVEQLAEMGQLVASIGHEMRNSLGAIETSAYLLSQRLDHLVGADPHLAKHLDKIRRHVQQASKTAYALLELAKHRSPRCAPIDLSDLLGHVLKGLERSEGVVVEVAVPENLSVWADGDQLRVVLDNLLSNATQAVGQHGTIRIEATACASGTTLLVGDDGPGIAISERTRIFELLHTTKCKGTGLGLPLCQRIVAAHGGSLTLQPSEHGATFQVWFPCEKHEA